MNKYKLKKLLSNCLLTNYKRFNFCLFTALYALCCCVCVEIRFFGTEISSFVNVLLFIHSDVEHMDTRSAYKIHLHSKHKRRGKD